MTMSQSETAAQIEAIQTRMAEEGRCVECSEYCASEHFLRGAFPGDKAILCWQCNEVAKEGVEYEP